ncbi:uncharacterized protein METZ01_LOCUS369967 [marine metagenome]|uniref:Uncharacterized protein n=1 Tax=marine metagenome TaxID=408172 RepID=A0A382T534_9ZZZZ
MDGSLPEDLVIELIQHSYDLVVNGMSKKDQARVKEQSSRPKESDNNWREEFLRDISQ